MNTTPLRYFLTAMLAVALAVGVMLSIVGLLSKMSGLPGWLMLMLGGVFISIVAGVAIDWVAS